MQLLLLFPYEWQYGNACNVMSEIRSYLTLRKLLINALAAWFKYFAKRERDIEIERKREEKAMHEPKSKKKMPNVVRWRVFKRMGFGITRKALLYDFREIFMDKCVLKFMKVFTVKYFYKSIYNSFWFVLLIFALMVFSLEKFMFYECKKRQLKLDSFV